MKIRKRNTHESLNGKEDLIAFAVRRRHASGLRPLIKMNI